MRSTFAPLAFAAIAAAAPQGSAVTSAISPSTTAEAGCSPNYPGEFQIQLLNATNQKRSVEKRQDNGQLMIKLENGILTDSKGRTGYIASNRQFQFDGPAQAGAIYTAGWTVCANNSLAIGSDAIFKACLSGEFYNLYDQNGAPQCDDVYIQVYGAGASAPGAGTGEQGDGQPTGSAVSQIADGQPQATGAVSQIGDGQIQAPSAAVSQIGDGQIQAPTAAVSQIGDGQIQAPTAAVSQIGDGQIQAPTAAVSQIGDGQIQAPTAAVTQIGDGQIQAPTAAVTQIGDGQIQAPTAAVSQISDGQIQAPTGNTTVAKPTSSPQPYTGAASSVNGAAFSLVAAVVMAVAML